MSMLDLWGEPFRIRLDGPPAAPILLLSHPLGTDLDVWQPQIAAFSRHFRVLRHDCRGHGASAVTGPPYGIDRLGRDAVAILDALGISRVHFCGLSMGGLIGQWLGINAPERIERMVLANTAAHIGDAGLWNARMAAVAKGGMEAVVRPVLERWFTPGFLASPSGEPERVAQLLRAAPPVGYMASCGAIRDADFRPQTARIAAPILVLAGIHDIATPPEGGRALAESIPGAAFMELPAPHLSNAETPDAFNRAALGFLTA